MKRIVWNKMGILNIRFVDWSIKLLNWHWLKSLELLSFLYEVHLEYSLWVGKRSVLLLNSMLLSHIAWAIIINFSHLPKSFLFTTVLLSTARAQLSDFGNLRHYNVWLSFNKITLEAFHTTRDDWVSYFYNIIVSLYVCVCIHMCELCFYTFALWHLIS